MSTDLGTMPDTGRCAAQLWTHVDTELYELSVYVGYVAAGFLIAEFLFLIVFQEAVRRFDARKHPRGMPPPATALCRAFRHAYCFHQ